MKKKKKPIARTKKTRVEVSLPSLNKLKRAIEANYVYCDSRIGTLRSRFDELTRLAETMRGIVDPGSNDIAPNDRPAEWETIAAAINSYIPHGRAYDDERFALQRWLNKAGNALLASERRLLPSSTL